MPKQSQPCIFPDETVRALDAAGRLIDNEVKFKASSEIRKLARYSPRNARHSMSVGSSMYHFPKSQGLSHAACMAMGFAGLFHDIGKLNIDLGILNKGQEREPHERIKKMEHIELGIVHVCEMGLPILLEAICVEAILHHHRRCDGSGYPRELDDPNIPILARTIAIGDVFEHICNGHHHPPRTPADAIKIMNDQENRNIPKKLDPVLLAAFTKFVKAKGRQTVSDPQPFPSPDLVWLSKPPPPGRRQDLRHW